MIDLFQIATLGALGLGAIAMFFIGALVAHLVYTILDWRKMSKDKQQKFRSADVN